MKGILEDIEKLQTYALTGWT